MSEVLTSVIQSIAAADLLLSQAEEIVDKLKQRVTTSEVGMADEQVESGNGRYKMPNLLAVQQHFFLEVGELIDRLYCLLNEPGRETVEKLKQLFEEANLLFEKNSARFPASGVFVDCDRGVCADHLSQILCSRHFLASAYGSMTDPAHELRNRVVADSLRPLIGILENYESAMGDPKCGIFDRTSFEKSYFAHWELLEAGVTLKNETSLSGSYVMKNKCAIILRPFTPLSGLLRVLYKVRNFLVEKEDPFEELRERVETAMYLGESGRFPHCGVYIDLERGTCADYYRSLILHSQFWRWNWQSCEDHEKRQKINEESISPLINLLESYDSHLSDPDSGIYNQEAFEQLHSARWVVQETSEANRSSPAVAGHYKMTNALVKMKRRFVALSSLLQVSYRLRRNKKGDPEFEQFKQLCNEPRPIELNKRFPLNKIYVDLTRGTCAEYYYSVKDYRGSRSLQSLIDVLEDYSSHMADVSYGIYDREQFEKHFSATWTTD